MTSTNTLRSRLSSPVKHAPVFIEMAAAVNKANADGVLSETVTGLIALRVGQLLGSTYFTARAAADSKDTPARIAAVATWRTATVFTDEERAVLAVVDAVHTPNPTGERVSDEVYDEAVKHFGEKGVATIAAVLGQIGTFAPLALIGKPIPGVSFAEQWTE